MITRAQRVSLHRIWLRNDQGLTYRQFRKTATHGIGMDCILVQWSGMWLGIEPDGYTHS
jgi:hypothetical protein